MDKESWIGVMFKPERNVESRRFKKEKYKRKEELKECESSENEIRYSEKKKRYLSVNHCPHIYLSSLLSDSAKHAYIFDIILE